MSLELLGIGITMFKRQLAKHNSSITQGLSLPFNLRSTLQLFSSVTSVFRFVSSVFLCSMPFTGLKNPFCSF